MSTTELTVPVLIVGAGPAGLTASLALRRHGIDHLVVEQYPSTAHTPRAHIVNQRTVEIKIGRASCRERVFALV